MVDRDALELRQVMNVFSASGLAHAQNVACMHRHIHRSVEAQAELPKNENIIGIADMLTEASKIYCQCSPLIWNGSWGATQTEYGPLYGMTKQAPAF